MKSTVQQSAVAFLILSISVLAASSSHAAPLYFPHIATGVPWQTEIALINTSSSQAVTGTLRALSNAGQQIDAVDVSLSVHGRKQITVKNEFIDHSSIGYIIFDTNSDTVQGYTKFYQAGKYRASIPAVKTATTSDIYIPHIATDMPWQTGISLVNTTSERKDLTITFNNGLRMPYTLNAHEHKAFDVAQEFFNNPPRPDIQSAEISNASGIVGLELFGAGNQLDGILLTGKTATTLYYPHVAGGEWWTGIVAYNPWNSACTINVTPYTAQGTPLTPSTFSIAGKGKFVGEVAQLGLPSQTAWFRIDSSHPLIGFELFGTTAGNQLAAYNAGGVTTGGKTGVFPKIEKSGWTGIAFVNTEDSPASITLTAYGNDGMPAVSQSLTVDAHAKVVNTAEKIFSCCSNVIGVGYVTYIAYTSDRNVVGFQLNGSSDGAMLDGLPGLAGTDISDTMIPLPGGSFLMGDAIDGMSGAQPVRTVTLNAFHMDKFEVTKALWDEVCRWATTRTANWYAFDNPGTGTAADHPVYAVSWYDAVKWLNARSEKEGRTPAYYTDQTQRTVYRTGHVDVVNSAVKWDANGYRLPTEAEWEYAARANTMTRFYTGSCISSDMQANYCGTSPEPGCIIGQCLGRTTAVGSYPANPWGLYDMAGNVREWIWDRYGAYPSTAETDPRGPETGPYRVLRDGYWSDGAIRLRSAYRHFNDPNNRHGMSGFRSIFRQPQGVE